MCGIAELRQIKVFAKVHKTWRTNLTEGGYVPVIERFGQKKKKTFCMHTLLNYREVPLGRYWSIYYYFFLSNINFQKQQQQQQQQKKGGKRPTLSQYRPNELFHSIPLRFL